ncbi:hypothetical protein ACFLZV_04430 [Candidatus Margulisiibacteriota bacterium]
MKKIYGLTILLLALLVFQNNIVAMEKTKQVEDNQGLKFASNIVNILALGDMNINFENTLDRASSFLVGAHLNPDNSTKHITGESGGYIAYRAYTEFQTTPSLKDYLQVTIAGNIEDKKIIPSMEFWAGLTSQLNQTALYYELAIGVGRKFRDHNNFMILFGFNMGFLIK